MSGLWGVDTGTEKSGFVLVDTSSFPPRVVDKGIVSNHEMRALLREGRAVGGSELVLEMIESYGMPVGRSTFETVRWIGRFQEVFEGVGRPTHLVLRGDVKMHMCGTRRAKDPNIRQAVIDMYPADGGGKNPVIGITSRPGPLYGMADHMWPALAVVITHLQSIQMELARNA